MISLFWPTIFKKEWLNELSSCFDTRWIGQGPIVDLFESEFATKFGYQYCLSTNSGSSALELAYHLVGITNGDEIITPVLTCSATNIPLLRRKAKIIFADIDKNTLNIDPTDVANKITSKTRAIVVVNLGGIACDKRVYQIAKSHKIPVIVDACQSLGTENPHGDFICYSFQAIKHFTTGDGGMLVVRNKQNYKRAKKLRWFGIDRERKIKNNWRCYSGRQICSDINEPGYKFHMNDISARLGLVGLRHSNEILQKRKKLAEYYKSKLDSTYQCIAGGSFWSFCLLGNKTEIMQKLSKTAECDVVHIRNDILHAFGGVRQHLPNMNQIENKMIYIPLHPNITQKDAHLIVKLLQENL